MQKNCRPNPIIFRRKKLENISAKKIDGDGKVVGTGDKIQTILVVPDEKGTKMNMYALGTEKESIFKKDLVGDIFIKYESKTDEIVYLENLRP